ncbi:hypothetical protein [Streptomyces sp. NPDC004658]|uniref:hypothetical protein n=1 Tax=Streptomyces sp. NPDC004658 TaxID=3154672 RepID=UPI0033BC89C6
MQELRLIDDNGYLVIVPGHDTVIVLDDDADTTEAEAQLRKIAEIDADIWRGVAREHAMTLGGENTVNGRLALAKVRQYDARKYTIRRTTV